MSNYEDNNDNMTPLNKSFSGFHSQTWSQAIVEHEQQGVDYVIATVLGTTGSTPRATGTKMIISAEHIYDTLGGGHLEYVVIEKSRQLLKEGQRTQTIENFQLAANLGQCCGGSAVVMFEAMVCQKMKLDIYGAGHVGQALVSILAQLPIAIRWIDERADVFPEHTPANVVKVIDEDPTAIAKSASPNSAFLILTHSHQLDFDLTEAILKRNDALWLGVIGSVTKAKRFKHRLNHRGYHSSQVEKMTSPVGLDAVSGKLPMEVAVSIAGQLINLYQSQTNESQKNQGAQWKTIKNVLTPQSSDTKELKQKVTSE